MDLTRSKFLGLRGEMWKHILLLGPLIIYLAIFFVYPLSGLLTQSVFDPNLTSKHYLMVFKYPVYMQVFWNTLEISLVVTLTCILMGYPVAYFLSESKSNWAIILLVSIMLPFWISILVRTYAWMLILGRHGVINELLMGLGLIEVPLRLMYNRIGVNVGMIYIMLPYAILPMVSVMKGIDRTLVQAADSLGSTPWQSFIKVFLPLSLPGVGAAFLLTFIRCMGFFVTPALMGSSYDAMIAMSIQNQLEELANWGFASALGVSLLIVILILFFIFNHFFGFDILLGGKVKNQAGLSKRGRTKKLFFDSGTIARIKETLWNEKSALFLEEKLWNLQDHISKLQKFISRLIPEFFRELRWGRIWVVGISFGIFIFMIIPVFIIIPIAFSNETYLHFPPNEWGLKLIKGFFSSELWINSTLHSFQVAIPVTILATLLGTLASLSLARGNYGGKQYWYAFILSPIIIPVIISAISVYFFFAKLKLIGTITALVLAHTVLAVPYVVIVVTSVLKGFDVRLEQASMSLGAGRVRTFFKVTLPMIRPGILTASLFAFIASFDELVGAMFICGVTAVTLPKQMWDGIRDEISPTIAAIAAMLIFLTVLLMLLAVILRQREKKLYSKKLGSSPMT